MVNLNLTQNLIFILQTIIESSAFHHNLQK